MSEANRGHVLLVDDDLELLEVTAEALQAAGFKVDTARDGLEALACLETAEPEVVVADVEMPVMDGYELCRRVRASGRGEIPFLFCSGRGAPDERLEGLRVGADDYLQKPANTDELVLKLTRQVERVRQFRAVSASSPPSTRRCWRGSKRACSEAEGASIGWGASSCARSWAGARWARSSRPGTRRSSGGWP